MQYQKTFSEFALCLSIIHVGTKHNPLTALDFQGLRKHFIKIVLKQFS